MEKIMDSSILTAYPEYDRKLVDHLLAEEVKNSRFKIVVLDDDPTGVQTVHDVSVYTDWSPESIRSGFAEPERMFFILTNSRGFTVAQTEKAHREIAQRVDAAAKEAGMEYVIVSRGDSTLRGHYPLETELLREEMERLNNWKLDGEILCPYFREGGRYTVDDIHYVKYGNELVPAGQTEFAQDKTFGYAASNLCQYVEEKTNREFPAEGVTSISLQSLRSMELDDIEQKILGVSDFGKIVVNAVCDYDVKVFCIALYRAIRRGRHYLFRTAAAFVREFGCVGDRPLLSRKEMIRAGEKAGGIVIIGSHTEKTTMQLEKLKKVEGLRFIEMDSDLVTRDGALEQEAARIISVCEACIRQGVTAVVFTKRKVLSLEHDTREAALVRSVRISDAVQSIVGKLEAEPAFIVAKGGITSSDIGTKALGVRRARVMGQICPGIPVWQTGRESRFPGIPYVIFPGNVGEADTLRDVVEILCGQG